MQRENKWQDSLKHTAKLVPQSQRELFLSEIETIIDRAVAEERKAFGGCTKCYGKGYATTKSFTHYCADFIGDKSYLTENSKIRPCSCDRGNQIKEIINLIK